MCYDGVIDPGAFELLLGGVSSITHEALVSIAALAAGSLVMDGWRRIARRAEGEG